MQLLMFLNEYEVYSSFIREVTEKRRAKGSVTLKLKSVGPR
jgi:hypothetical protein